MKKILLLSAVLLSACVRPTSIPLSAEAPPELSAADALETRRECRQLRDRAFWTAAWGTASASIAAGLGGVALPTDDRKFQIGLGVAGITTAALSAAFMLLSTSYQGALDTHCSPWPKE